MIQDPVFDNLLKMLSASLGGSVSDVPVDPGTWPSLRKELESQSVLSLVSDYIGQSGADPAIIADISGRTVSSIREFHKLMLTQKALTELFDGGGIKYAVMKGAAAGQYYPRPELRQYGDIDVLVPPADYDRTFELMVSSGYTNQQELDSPNKRHIGFIASNGVHIELHRYFSSSESKEENELLDGWLYDRLNDPAKIQVCGYSFYVFPTLENGLILLGHINQHLGSGLGLRQIIDWMMYVKAVLNDEYWESQFRERAEAIGMDYLAKTVTRMCQLYLGLSDEITWCSDADDSLAGELLEYIHSKGNFGKKEKRTTRSTLVVLHSFRNPVTTFRYLTAGGMLHMEEAGHKPRKAYAWIYQIGRLTRMAIKRKDKAGIVSEVKRASGEVDLLKRLKVTKI